MGRKPTDAEQQRFVEYLRDARDEMNLLEHSISSASTKVDRKTRSVVFTKSDVDPDTSEPIERTWEIKFRDGRPTSIDDDVFVALLKLSADVGFAAKRVDFTRLQVCKILGWADKGQNYKKIDDALTRLRGVSIDAKNYWYDNKLKCWRDRDFNIFDVSDVLGRSTYQKALKAGGKEAARSWIEWSDTMMESFAAGYLRKFDLNEYLSIENPVARKLYRFLGKHFWHRTKCVLELETLMHEKLGYEKGETRLWRLRQKLEPAVVELEAKGIYGLSHEFIASYGKCEVAFIAKKKTSDKDEAPAAVVKVENPTAQRLRKIGIDAVSAADAVKRLSAERITEDIEHVEHEAKAGRVKSSKAGMLASMLKSPEPWPRPQGFLSSIERARKNNAAAEKAAKERTRKAEQEAREREEEAENRQAFNAFVAELTDIELQAFDERARRIIHYGSKYREALAGGVAEAIAEARQNAYYTTWYAGESREKRTAAVQ